MEIFKLLLRFPLPLIAILVGAAWFALPLLDQLTLHRFEQTSAFAANR